LKPEWWGAPLVQKRRSTRGKGTGGGGGDDDDDDILLNKTARRL
jgi:hypothetical protein